MLFRITLLAMASFLAVGGRNLVHPGNELRQKLAFGHEEARIALEVLNMVDRELTP
jgi:hypothetical protein